MVPTFPLMYYGNNIVRYNTIALAEMEVRHHFSTQYSLILFIKNTKKSNKIRM